MSEIQFGQTHGEQLATLMRVVRDIHRDFYGNGSPGIKRRAEQFMDAHEAVKREQAAHHEQNTRKLNYLMVVATIVGVLVALATFLVGVSAAKRGELDPIKIFSSQSHQPEYTHDRPTVAKIPFQP